MKSLKLNIAIAAGLLLSACASEAPFDGPQDKQKGSFAKSALNLQVHTDHIIKQTKADEVTLDDVVVTFFTPDHQLLDHYIYGYMPSVVVLNQGDYYLSAVYSHFGEEKPFAAAFDAPFYQGDSNIFQIKPNEITSDLDVVKCELQNVMTSVVFDDYLKQNMADDSYVELKINENGENPLNFNLEHEGGKHYGYFECKGEQTLVATFHGKINGAETSETKTVSNVSAGNHYRITFKLHDYQGENTGSHDTNVVLDASVTKTDKDGTVSIEEMGLADNKLDENERPGEDPENPDDPTPDNPDERQAPQITASEGSSIKLGETHLWNPGEDVILIITSTAEEGIEGFEVDIISPSLSDEALAGVGLASHLDLVNPKEELIEPLQGLGLLEGESVGGKDKVEFNITSFMPLLAALGDNVHTFKLKVEDANGKTEKELIIEIKNAN